MDKYDEWAQAWARGMRLAQPFTDARREAAKPKAVANRAAGAKRPCGIKGCKRHSYKGQLCRAHYQLVPWQSKLEMTMACIDAQLRTASRYHSRFLREARAAHTTSAAP